MLSGFASVEMKYNHGDYGKHFAFPNDLDVVPISQAQQLPCSVGDGLVVARYVEIQIPEVSLNDGAIIGTTKGVVLARP